MRGVTIRAALFSAALAALLAAPGAQAPVPVRVDRRAEREHRPPRRPRHGAGRRYRGRLPQARRRRDPPRLGGAHGQRRLAVAGAAHSGQAGSPRAARRDRQPAAAWWRPDNGGACGRRPRGRAGSWSGPIEVHPAPPSACRLDERARRGLAAFSFGGGSRDVRAARSRKPPGTSWPTARLEQVRDAGGGRGPRIAAAADGTALAAGEVDGSGRRRCNAPSAARPAQPSPPRSACPTSRAPGGDARNPEVGMTGTRASAGFAVEQVFDDSARAHARYGRRVSASARGAPAARLAPVGRRDRAIDPTWTCRAPARLRRLSPHAGRRRGVPRSSRSTSSAAIGRYRPADRPGRPGPDRAHASTARRVQLVETGRSFGRYWTRDEVLEGHTEPRESRVRPGAVRAGSTPGRPACRRGRRLRAGRRLNRRIVVSHWDVR